MRYRIPIFLLGKPSSGYDFLRFEFSRYKPKMDVKARNCLIMSKTNQKKEKISLKKKLFIVYLTKKMTITNRKTSQNPKTFKQNTN